MKKTSIVLMILAVISQGSGFLRELVLSFHYGASNISDAYLISLTIPMVIFAFIGRALSTSYIPVFGRVSEENENKALLFTNNLITILFSVTAIIIFICIIFTPQLVNIFASGFNKETNDLASSFTRISLFGLLSMIITNVLTSYLQYKNKYYTPALVGISMNIVIIISTYISIMFNNVYLLSIGTLIAMVSQVFLLLPKAYAIGFRYSLKLNFKDEDVQNIFKLSIPVILGVAVNEINVLVDRTLASQIVVGGISALNYANKMNGFIYGIFVFSITAILFPKMVKKIKEGKKADSLEYLKKSIFGVNILVIPASIGLMIFSTQIVQLLYGRGEFGQQAVALTSSTLFFYSIGIIAISLRQVISKAFYALDDTKTPMFNAIIGLFINIVLNIILSKIMGIGGLALATSLSAIITTILMFFSLEKKVGSIGLGKIIFSFFKILLCSLVMGVIAKTCYFELTLILSGSLAFLLSIILGICIYFLLIYLIRLEEMKYIIPFLKK
jgi:putative peptidoglycan lipid II flippase